MNELKIMEVKREDLQEGDLVLTSNTKGVYLITSIKVTLIHKNIYFNCYYPFANSSSKWTMQEVDPIKTICRLVEVQAGGE